MYRILTNIYSFFVFWKRSQIFNTTKLKKKKERKCDRKTLMMFAVAMKWWITTTFCLLTPTSQMDEAENQLQLQQTERPISSWVCFPKLEQEEACTYSHCSRLLLAILNAEFWVYVSSMGFHLCIYGLFSTFSLSFFFKDILTNLFSGTLLRKRAGYVIETMQASWRLFSLFHGWYLNYLDGFHVSSCLKSLFNKFYLVWNCLLF